MKRMLITALALGMFSFALVGCHAEGEIGDTAAPIQLAR